EAARHAGGADIPADVLRHDRGVEAEILVARRHGAAGVVADHQRRRLAVRIDDVERIAAGHDGGDYTEKPCNGYNRRRWIELACCADCSTPPSPRWQRRLACRRRWPRSRRRAAARWSWAPARRRRRWPPRSRRRDRAGCKAWW